MSSSNEQPPAVPASGRDRTPRRMRVTWKTGGPRTRAWDEMWRWLLAPDDSQPSGSADAPAGHDPEQEPGD